MGRIQRSIVVCVCVKLSGARLLAAESSSLPGPGLDVPVDVDGDAISTYGDRYAFNYWIELGGKLENALSSAEAGKGGVIDLSKFFNSSDALLAPRVEVVDTKFVEEEAGEESAGTWGGTALSSSSTCATDARLALPFGVSTILPTSVFTSCQYQFRYPTGADIDALQGLFCSYGRPTEVPEKRGVVLMAALSRVPPMGQDGTIPLAEPLGISNVNKFGAEDIVVRQTPPFNDCPLGGQYLIETYSMSTWPEINNHICPAIRYRTPPPG